MNCNPHMSFSEQDYHLIKTSLSKRNNQKEVLRYLTNVLPNPTDIVTLDNAQNTVKSVKAQLAKPYVSDFSTVTVTRCGKNFVDISDGNSAASEGTVDITESCPRGINIVVSAYLERSANQPFRLRIGYVVDGETNYLFGEMMHSSGINIVKGTIPISATQVSLTFQKLINSEGDIYWKNVQLEIGDSATPYEPYQGQTYTPAATDEVTGITVLTPTTNIINDKGLLFTKVTGDDFNYIN